MKCGEAKRSLSAYLDGELSAREAARLRAHLAECPSCRAELHFLERLCAISRKALARAPFDRALVEKTFVRIKERQVLAGRSFAFGRLVVTAAMILAAVAIVLFASYFMSDTGQIPAALAVDTGESAFVKHPGSSAWRQLRRGDRLYGGDVVKNASTGIVSLRTPRGSRLVLNQNTSVQMGADPPTATFELIGGEVFAEVAKEPFRVLCDGASVTVKGTRFSVRKESNRAVVTVIEGVVAYSSAREEVEVGPGQQSVAHAGCPPSEPESVNPARELEWYLGGTAAPADPRVIEPPAVVPPGPRIPAGTGPDLPLDRPLERPKKKDK